MIFCRFAIIQLQLCEIMRDADLRAGHCTVDTGNLINNIIGRRACSTALLLYCSSSATALLTECYNAESRTTTSSNAHTTAGQNIIIVCTFVIYDAKVYAVKKLIYRQ